MLRVSAMHIKKHKGFSQDNLF